MKRMHFSLSKIAAAFTVGFCLFAFNAKAQDETKTVSGEVLDMACYMAKGAQGESHKGCASACIKGGAPMGLLTSDGKIYLLVENHNKKEAYAKVKDYAGEKISVTGTISDKGGIQGVIVDDMKKN